MKRKYLFVHIPKTAGTSLFSMFRDVLGQDSVKQCSNYIYIDTVTASELDKYLLIGAHFKDFAQLKYFKNRYTITFLRDPVDRFLSQYFYFREVNVFTDEDEVNLAKTLDINEYVDYYKDEIIGRVVNRHAYHLVGEEHYSLSESELLCLAKENLKNIDFVGISEYFTESLYFLCYDCGWQPMREIPFDNATKGRKAVCDISKKTIERIKELNSLDMQLYEYGLKLYNERKFKILEECVKVKNSLTKEYNTTDFPLMSQKGETSAFKKFNINSDSATKIKLDILNEHNIVRANNSIMLEIALNNLSDDIVSSCQPHPIYLSYHWLNKDGCEVVLHDGERSKLTPQLEPRKSARYCLQVVTPENKGEYVLRVTLVQEGIAWFDNFGVYRDIRVIVE